MHISSDFHIENGILKKYHGSGENVVIPQGVTAIGGSAFAQCGSILSVIIPRSVTSIGDKAFSGCISLQSVDIPECVTYLGYKAFFGCKNLHSAVIPKGVTSIGNGTFTGCQSLQSITVPEGVTFIGNEAFYKCLNLKSVTISKGVTSIGDRVFGGCMSLQSMSIPEGVTSISNRAFYGCRILESVTIPKSVASIGKEAFSECTNLKSVTIPEGTTSIGDRVFYQCRKLQSVVIPKGITSIGNRAFYGCIRLQSVTIPESVTSIGDLAFFGCMSLQSVSIPEGVISIGDRAFCNCKKLADPEGFVIVDHVLYNYYGQSHHVSIPESVTYICDLAFQNSRNLTTLYLPDGITHIGYDAFENCDNLTSVQFPESVKELRNTLGKNRCFQVLITSGIKPDHFQYPEHKLAAAIGFLTHKEQFQDPDIAQAYQTYILRQRKDKLLNILFSLDSEQGLAQLADMGRITAASFDAQFLQPALAAKASQCVAFLMEWKNRNISSADIEKQFQRELNKDPFNTADMKKLWSFVKRPDGTVSITGYKGSETTLVIPARIGKSPVTAIEEMAFCPDKSRQTKERKHFLNQLESVIVSEGIQSIGQKAFYNCGMLTTVSIPESVTAIGYWAFPKKTKLQVRSGSYAEDYAWRNAFQYTAQSSHCPKSV